MTRNLGYITDSQGLKNSMYHDTISAVKKFVCACISEKDPDDPQCASKIIKRRLMRQELEERILNQVRQVYEGYNETKHLQTVLKNIT